MAANWYYVKDGERHGPIDQSVLEQNILNYNLKEDDYVWTKGQDDWKKIFEIPELQKYLYPDKPQESVKEELPPFFDVRSIDYDKRVFTIQIGVDRGRGASEYGPYSINILKKLYKENRINGKTLIFAPGMLDWQFLADLVIFQEVFEELPPIIEEKERRQNKRKPFVARMLFHNKTEVFEGTCRDISIGGMQVLISGVPLTEGDNISMNVHPENSDYCFVASGEVVRLLEGGQGFSFRFIDLSQEAKDSINKYIDYK